MRSIALSETRETRKGPILIAADLVPSCPSMLGTVLGNTFMPLEDPVGLAKSLSEDGWEVHVAIPDEAVEGHGVPACCEDARAPERSNRFGKRVTIWRNLPRDPLAFQREVISTIVPRVNPVLIHCIDCGAALIPSATRKHKTPCLLTVHTFPRCTGTLHDIENGLGKDVVDWQYLYYKSFPRDYGSAESGNSVDFLASGIFAAHWFDTGSLTFLDEVIQRRHGSIPYHIAAEIGNKRSAGFAADVPYGVSELLFPERSPYLKPNYGPDNHVEGKLSNKRALQKVLGLECDDRAPLFLWCSGLQPEQDGFRLMADHLYEIVTHRWAENVELVLVASGEIRESLAGIIRLHGLSRHAAVVDASQDTAHTVYAAADFLLAPSLYEPSALPAKVGLVNGCFPVAFETGAIKETVTKIDGVQGTGNGFLFNVYGLAGLMWGMEQALGFFRLPQEVRVLQRKRIMAESARNFAIRATACCYDALYRRMLSHPMDNLF